MLEKIIAGSSAASLVVLGLLLINTTPSDIGPMGILIVFILMYVSALGMLTFLLFGLNLAAARFAAIVPRRTHREPLTLRKSYYYGSVLAMAPVMIIAMQSVNEVGPYHLLLVVVFIATACIYIAKRTA